MAPKGLDSKTVNRPWWREIRGLSLLSLLAPKGLDSKFVNRPGRRANRGGGIR